MAKILISWMATLHDFTDSGTINTDGPNCSIHKYYYEGYSKHVLLTSAPTTMADTKYQRLVNYLRKEYGCKIEEVALDIKDSDLINLSAISKAVNKMLLTKYKNDDIEVFISPGTPTMQVAWYMARISVGLNIQLFQTIRPEKIKSGSSGKILVTADQVGYISSLFLKEAHNTDTASTSDIVMPDILKPVYKKASKIALADVSVLITGKTGTGKERLARHIHNSSHRKDGKFVVINCASLGDGLLESRLFGYKKGSFTGAIKDTEGLFREANGGTIFLDEIGDISPYMQQTLLRALSEKEIMKVGSNSTESINVRIIAATNKDIYEMSMNDRYRADLYYRLSTCEIHLPSLAEYSPKEKEMVFSHIWKQAKNELKKKDSLKLPASIRKSLIEYNYPGNIREMENIIYGIWAEAEETVNYTHIPNRLSTTNILNSLKLKDVENNHIRKIYNSCDQNGLRASKILGISPATLRTRLSNC